jgi:hypothetical protein
MPIQSEVFLGQKGLVALLAQSEGGLNSTLFYHAY